MSDIKWGIGIEHEVIMMESIPNDIKGETLINNLGDDDLGDKSSEGSSNYFQQTVEQFIEPQCTYQSYTVTDDNPSDRLYNYFKGNPPLHHYLKTLIERYHKLVGLANITSDSDYYPTILTIIKGLHSDSTIIFGVIEFVTKYWQNKIISNSVEEINLQQEIVLECTVNYTRKGQIYPNIGAMFPLARNYGEGEQYYLDYTGSYHLNLSLPYQEHELQQEERYYTSKVDLIRNEVIAYLDSVKYGSSNRYALLQYYLEQDPFIRIRDIISKKTPELSDKLLTDSTLLREQEKYRNYQAKLQKQLPELKAIFHNNIKLSNVYISIIFSYRSILNLSLQIFYHGDDGLVSLETIKPRRLERCTPYFKKLYQDVFTFIHNLGYHFSESDRESRNVVCLRLHFLDDKLFKLAKIERCFDFKQTTTIDSVESMYQDAVPVIPGRTLDDTFNINHLVDNVTDLKQVLSDLYQDKLLFPFQNHLDWSISNINNRCNIYHKYKITNWFEGKGFHALHLNWAIAIQWVLPLLLSCFSSCDPFSIGDNDKLTELSLRLFISGYSFINLSDVMNYGLPTSRGLLPWQTTQSDITSISHNAFSYKLGDGSGSEFRVDSSKGFDFGFEIRIFDNFDITHLDTLLEFLFLLADRVANSDHKFTENPFNNKFLNRETMRILGQGWNTRISIEYLYLLEKQLGLKLEVDGIKGLTAYDIANDLYRLLQEEYLDLDTGRGKGPYSQYVINRESGLKALPNINKTSWETNFKTLIWDPKAPKTQIRMTIEDCLVYSGGDLTRLERLLTKRLGSPYSADIEDILYALQALGKISY